MVQPFEEVPELSLTDWTDNCAQRRQTFQETLFEGLKVFGFVILKDHGIDRALLHHAYDLSAKFFALNETTKMKFAGGPDGQRGYTPFGREHAKDSSVPDLKEFYHIGRPFDKASPLEGTYPANIWPDGIEGFRESFLALYAALENAGMIMLDALAPSLKVPAYYFREMAFEGNSILRLLHYPPVSDDAPPHAVRAAAHEDINLITILVAANGSGLQLLDRNEQWLPIETDPDNLIIDAGDMLARICNDTIPATTHRVINPTGPNISRYSMPFFMHPHPNAILSCIESCRGIGAKYPDITADDFLKQRLREIGLT